LLAVIVMQRLRDANYFLAGRLVFVGVSACSADITRQVLRALLSRGTDVVPIRPGFASLDGALAYPCVADVPGTIDGALIMNRCWLSERTIDELTDKGIDRIWLVDGADNRRVTALCELRHIDLTTLPSPLAYLESRTTLARGIDALSRLLGRA